MTTPLKNGDHEKPKLGRKAKFGEESELLAMRVPKSIKSDLVKKLENHVNDYLNGDYLKEGEPEAKTEVLKAKPAAKTKTPKAISNLPITENKLNFTVIASLPFGTSIVKKAKTIELRQADGIFFTKDSSGEKREWISEQLAMEFFNEQSKK